MLCKCLRYRCPDVAPRGTMCNIEKSLSGSGDLTPVVLAKKILSGWSLPTRHGFAFSFMKTGPATSVIVLPFCSAAW